MTTELIAPDGLELRHVPWTFKFGDIAKAELESPYCAPVEGPTRMAFLSGVGEHLPIIMEVNRFLGRAGLKLSGVDVPYPAHEGYLEMAREVLGFAKDASNRTDEQIEHNRWITRYSTENIIKGTMQGFLPAVVRDMNRRDNLGEDTPLDAIIGYSKGSGETLLSVLEADDAGVRLAKKIILVNPAGALSQHLGDVPKKTYARAMRETIERFEPWRLTDKNLRPGYNIPEIPGAEETNRLIYALSRTDGPDVINDLYERGYDIEVLAATDDLVCPPDDLRRQLGSLAHLLTEIPGHHATLCHISGLLQMEMAARRGIGTTEFGSLNDSQITSKAA